MCSVGAQKEAQICKDFSVLLHLNDYCGYNNLGGRGGGRKKWGKQDLVFCWYTQGFNGCRYVIQNCSELVMLFSSSSVFQFIFFFFLLG